MEDNALNVLNLGRPVLIGHRGYSAIAPENTLPSFELALNFGVDLIELDYHHSRDDVPVVIHDDLLDRTTDARRRWRRLRIRVANRTAAEIQSLDAGGWFEPHFAGTKVPLLSEALDFICGNGGMALVEHKSGDAETCVQLLRRRKLVNRVVIMSFDWKFLREFHELEPAQVLGALGPPDCLADGSKRPPFSKALAPQWLVYLAATGARLVVWNSRISKRAVDEARRRGLPVWVYTIDDWKVARRLLDIGVAGIITNDPRRIRDLVFRPR
jgi:glycerophosphoryl diester phosphodiesterase